MDVVLRAGVTGTNQEDFFNIDSLGGEFNGRGGDDTFFRSCHINLRISG